MFAMEKEEREKWELHEQLKEKEVELTQQREERLAGIETAVKTAKVDAAEKAELARNVSCHFLISQKWSIKTLSHTFDRLIPPLRH